MKRGVSSGQVTSRNANHGAGIFCFAALAAEPLAVSFDGRGVAVFCPVCRDEYQAGFSRCDRCSVPLVESLAPEPEPTQLELETVLETGDQSLVVVAKSLLDSAGIPCVARNEGLQNLFGWGSIGTGFNVAMGPIRLQVLREDEKVARELLKTVPSSPDQESDS